MNIELLIESASKLQQPSEDAYREYVQHKELMIDQVIKVLEAREDLENLIGVNNLEMMKDNAHNMARFMESIFMKYNHQVLVETVLWVFRAYRSHGFHLTFWSAHLNCWLNILQKTLTPETYRELYPYYFWMQVNIPVFIKLTGVEDDQPQFKNTDN